jgi:peptidoglycan/LPS O-acetylase OafA/YrhL
MSAAAFLAFGVIAAFMPTFWSSSAFFLNGPMWSLFLEIVANALHGLVFGSASIRWLLALYIIAATAFVAAYFAGHAEWGPDLLSILWLFPREITCYLAGILIFRVWGDRPLGKMPYAAVAGFVALMLNVSLGPVASLAAFFVLCPLLVRAALGMPSATWATAIGALSYPLYATHVPAIRLAKFAGLPPAAAMIVALLIAAIVTFGFEARRTMQSKVTPLSSEGVA